MASSMENLRVELHQYLAGMMQTLLTWWLDNTMPYSPGRMNEMFMQLVMGGVTAVIPSIVE